MRKAGELKSQSGEEIFLILYKPSLGCLCLGGACFSLARGELDSLGEEPVAIETTAQRGKLVNALRTQPGLGSRGCLRLALPVIIYYL